MSLPLVMGLEYRPLQPTAGYINPQPAVEFFAGMDAANVDLKGFSESFYHQICGGHLQPVLETLCYVHRHTSVWLELTTLLIPGLNDSDADPRVVRVGGEPAWTRCAVAFYGVSRIYRAAGHFRLHPTRP